MTFLIFVGAFVTLACLIVPLMTLALFATFGGSARVPEGHNGARASVPSRGGLAVSSSGDGVPSSASGASVATPSSAPAVPPGHPARPRAAGRPIDFSVPTV